MGKIFENPDPWQYQPGLKMLFTILTLSLIAFLPTAFLVDRYSKLQGNDWSTHQIAREYVGSYLASTCEFVPGYHADYAGPCLMLLYTYLVTAQIIGGVVLCVLAAKGVSAMLSRGR